MRGAVSVVFMAPTLQRNQRSRANDTNLYKFALIRHTPDTPGELNGHRASWHYFQPTIMAQAIIVDELQGHDRSLTPVPPLPGGEGYRRTLHEINFNEGEPE
jgi:hypothetical protein